LLVSLSLVVDHKYFGFVGTVVCGPSVGQLVSRLVRRVVCLWVGQLVGLPVCLFSKIPSFSTCNLVAVS